MVNFRISFSCNNYWRTSDDHFLTIVPNQLSTIVFSSCRWPISCHHFLVIVPGLPSVTIFLWLTLTNFSLLFLTMVAYNFQPLSRCDSRQWASSNLFSGNRYWLTSSHLFQVTPTSHFHSPSWVIVSCHYWLLTSNKERSILAANLWRQRRKSREDKKKMNFYFL